MAHRKTSKRPKAKAIASATRFGAVQECGSSLTRRSQFARIIRPCHRRIHRMVLFEPRLAFNRTVVLRYRFFLEQKNLAPSTINVRLAAVRRHL